MPTYDYVCGACGAALEIYQSMSESAKKKCPECGALKLVRQIGAGAGILFKGGGFYETDYRSESYKAGAKAESDSKKKPESSDKPDQPGQKSAKKAAEPKAQKKDAKKPD